MDGSVVMRGAEILTDIHHGISSLATMRALASMSGDPSERRWPTCWLRAPPPGALPITLGVGEVKIRSFLGNRWAVLPGVERLSKWPKLAFHGVTAVPHQESLSSCRQAIMGQRSIGAGFHTFLRRAIIPWCPSGARTPLRLATPSVPSSDRSSFPSRYPAGRYGAALPPSPAARLWADPPRRTLSPASTVRHTAPPAIHPAVFLPARWLYATH